MGTDKARVAWGTRPLAVAVVYALRSCCARVALIRRHDDGLPWIDDEDQSIEMILEPALGEEHPLWGICTALTSARTDVALVAPCDAPSLTQPCLNRLIDAAPAVATDGRTVNPLIAALPREMAQTARDLALAGAPAHHLVREARRVLFSAEELRDHDDPSGLGPGPIERLLARIPHVSADEQASIAEGERARLRARGIVHLDAESLPSR